MQFNQLRFDSDGRMDVKRKERKSFFIPCSAVPMVGESRVSVRWLWMYVCVSCLSLASLEVGEEEEAAADSDADFCYFPGLSFMALHCFRTNAKLLVFL